LRSEHSDVVWRQNPFLTITATQHARWERQRVHGDTGKKEMEWATVASGETMVSEID
jgi:hypothetical protein